MSETKHGTNVSVTVSNSETSHYIENQITPYTKSENPHKITPEKLDSSGPRSYVKPEYRYTEQNELQDIATSCFNFFIFTLERKLDGSRSHIYNGDSYTLDDDIIAAYTSINIQDWLTSFNKADY